VSTADDVEVLLTDVADTGELVEMFVVTDGKNLCFVEEMCRMQIENFPHRPFVPDEIRRDALLPSQRDGLVVAQWFYTVDGATASYHLSDINLVRRTHTIKFGSVEKPFRRTMLRERRFNLWLIPSQRAQVTPLIGDGWLGSFAEAADYSLPVLLPAGWIPLPIDYQEPVHGPSWRELGLETERTTIIWMPPDALTEAEIAELQPRVLQPAAASFLLDIYGLDASIPWVAELCGDQVDVARPQREPR